MGTKEGKEERGGRREESGMGGRDGGMEYGEYGGGMGGKTRARKGEVWEEARMLGREGRKERGREGTWKGGRAANHLATR